MLQAADPGEKWGRVPSETSEITGKAASVCLTPVISVSLHGHKSVCVCTHTQQGSCSATLGKYPMGRGVENLK